MRGRAAGGERDARQALRLDGREIRQGQLLGNEDPAIGQLRGLLLDAEQVAQQAMPDVAHVGGALAQIPVAHAREGADVLVHRELQGGLRREAIVEEATHLVEKALVLEHHAVRVEQAGIHIRHEIAHA